MTLIRPLLFLLLAAMLVTAAPLRAAGPRQQSPRTPIAPANVAQITDLGAVMETNRPLAQLDWIADDTLIALSPASTGDGPVAVLSGPAAYPLADQFAVLLRDDHALALSPDRARITVLNHGDPDVNLYGLRAYTLDDGAVPARADFFLDVKGAPGPVTYSPDGAQIAFVAYDEDMSIIFRVEAQTGVLLGRDEIPRRVYGLSFTPDSAQIAVSSEEGVELLAIDIVQLLPRWSQPAPMVFGVTVLDDKIITSREDGSLSAWALADGAALWNTEPGELITGTAMTPAHDVLAVGRSGGAIEFYDPFTGALIASLLDVGDTIDALAFSPDASLLAVATRTGPTGSLHLLGLPTAPATGPASTGPGSGDAPDGGMLSGSAPPPAGPPTDGTYPLDPPGESE